MSPTPTFAEEAKELGDQFATHPLIRAVNFHSTARVNADQYDKQFAQYAKFFTSVNEEELDAYLTSGRWHKSKPGLIVSIFEGYRNSYDVILPLIEKHGFIGWFWVITSYINAPVPDQLTFAASHHIRQLTREYPDGRYAMTWEELRQIDKRKHVIASHARSHTLLSALAPEVQYQEVVGSQEDFKKNLGHPVRGFVSLTGPPYGDAPAVDKLINEAAYEYVLSNYIVQRIHPRQ